MRTRSSFGDVVIPLQVLVQVQVVLLRVSLVIILSLADRRQHLLATIMSGRPHTHSQHLLFLLLLLLLLHLHLLFQSHN